MARRYSEHDKIVASMMKLEKKNWRQKFGTVPINRMTNNN